MTKSRYIKHCLEGPDTMTRQDLLVDMGTHSFNLYGDGQVGLRHICGATKFRFLSRRCAFTHGCAKPGCRLQDAGCWREPQLAKAAFVESAPLAYTLLYTLRLYVLPPLRFASALRARPVRSMVRYTLDPIRAILSYIKTSELP